MGRLMAIRQKPCYDWPLWFRRNRGRNPPRNPERNRPRLSSDFRSAFHPTFTHPPEPSHRLGSGRRQARCRQGEKKASAVAAFQALPRLRGWCGFIENGAYEGRLFTTCTCLDSLDL